ncbi:response regulator [Cellvibrio mixtus]|uniref:response regulator n=1 Tax=Cellvibrio mixtus TaxID=39650 RepID=UPI00058668C8|nr:response regulator [Cellvibrio mixtus]
MKSKIPLYFYPTQIVFVDDNREFLDTLSVTFSKHFNVKSFDDTDAALKYINEHQREAQLIANDEKPKLQGDSDAWVKQVLTHQNIKRFDELRIKEVSVLVVDYSMPSMNGIEFCEKIKNSAIKKILLTGYATPTEAVRAFNNNTIHYYLKKNDENMLHELKEAINQLQHSYFNDLSSSLKTEAIDSSTPFFADPKLARYFEEACETLGVSEYYYLINPSRFELRTRDEKTFSCVIYTEEDIQEHVQILQEEGAPDELYKAIASRNFVPLFHTADGFYEPGMENAILNIHPATRIQGTVNYYCAVISDAPASASLPIKAPTGILH